MELTLGVRTYDLTTRALVMGLLDLPRGGSFSGMGSADTEAWVGRAERMVGDGADVLQVGATPGAAAGCGVSEPEELDVVVPLVAALRQRVEVPLSCATARASVAGAAYAAGAVVGDDPSGFSDPGYLPAAVVAGASVVAHRPRPPPDPAPASGLHDVVGEVKAVLVEQAGRAERAGLTRGRILVDPGLEAAATPEQWLRLARATPTLAGLGHPLVVSVPQPLVARPAGEGPGDGRVTTVAASALAVVGGSRVLRTHDVRSARRVADVLAGILGAG